MRISLSGNLRISFAGRPVTAVNTNRLKSLIASLIVHGLCMAMCTASERRAFMLCSNYSLLLRAAFQGMAQREVNGRWQSEMASFFENLGDRNPDEGVLQLEEVFHLPEGC
jgi:L-rhamnose mutarotase